MVGYLSDSAGVRSSLDCAGMCRISGISGDTSLDHQSSQAFISGWKCPPSYEAIVSETGRGEAEQIRLRPDRELLPGVLRSVLSLRTAGSASVI